MKIGQRVRLLRRERDITQAGLAERSGLATNTINRIEKGHMSPGAETLARIAEALDAPVGTLYSEESVLVRGAEAPVIVRQGRADSPRPHSLEELLERSGVPGPYWLTRPLEEFQRFWRGVSLEEARDRFWQIHAEYKALSKEWENQKRGVPIGAPELQERMPDIYTDAFARHFFAMSAAPGKSESKGEFRAREQRGDTRPLRAVELGPAADEAAGVA